MFLSSGPHDIESALIWITPFWLLLIADWLGPELSPQHHTKLPNWFFNSLLYGLAFLQFFNLYLMLVFIDQLTWITSDETITSLVNLVVIRFLVGTSSGISGIIVAHELIHRPQKFKQYLGRLLLCSVCYEHFYIAHKRGHHRNVGKDNDITTARKDETFQSYWKRVYLEHLNYAWRFELKRLGLEGHWFGNFKIFRHRMLHGLMIEMLIFVLIILYFGWIAALMFLYQSIAAVRILEAVNYFQHWGLRSSSPNHALAWVNNSWWTGRILIGLSCHIDHHNNAAKPYQTLSSSPQGPIMPYGYFIMNLWVKLGNASYQRMAIKELEKTNMQL